MTPRLRFPEFRDEGACEERQLSSRIDLVSGVHLSPDQYSSTEGGVPYFTGPSDFTNDVGGVTKWTATGANTAKEHDTLITVKGSGVGEIWYLTIPRVAMGRQLMAVRATRCSSRFVYYFLLTKRSRFEDLASGNLIPGLSRRDILDLAVSFPSVQEQQKIADCLTSLDACVAAQGRKVEALQAHKLGLMQELFPREGETFPRLRFPEFHGSGKWAETTLSNVCEMRAGKFIAASDIAEERVADLFPCYGGNGLRGYTKSFTHVGKYPLIGRQGALCGNVGLFEGKFHATEHALVVTPKGDVDTDWLFYALDVLKLNRYSIGQAQLGLSVEVLERVSIVIPRDPAEQRRIADCLSTLDSRIAAESERLAALKSHKEGLMQQLFPSPKSLQA